MSASQGLSKPLPDVERDGSAIDDPCASHVAVSAQRRQPTLGAKSNVGLGVRLLRRYTWALLAMTIASLPSVMFAMFLSDPEPPRALGFVLCLPLFLAGYPVLLADFGAWFLDPTGAGQAWQVAFWTVLGVLCVAHLVASIHLWRSGQRGRSAAIVVLTELYLTIGALISFARVYC